VDRNGLTREDWTKLGHYLAQGSLTWNGIITPDVMMRK